MNSQSLLSRISRSVFSPARGLRGRHILALCISIFVGTEIVRAQETGKPPAREAGQNAMKAKYGDWEMRCETPPGSSKEQCALVQAVAADDKPNVNLVVIVLKTADGKSYLLRVIAPLGILLPNGLGLKVDATDIGYAGFVRCRLEGCVAEVIMDDKLLNTMRSAKTATFIIYETPEEGVGIPLNMNGFQQGFGALP